MIRYLDSNSVTKTWIQPAPKTKLEEFRSTDNVITQIPRSLLTQKLQDIILGPVNPVRATRNAEDKMGRATNFLKRFGVEFRV